MPERQWSLRLSRSFPELDHLQKTRLLTCAAPWAWQDSMATALS